MDGGDLLTSCMSDPLYCRRTHGATWLVRDTCDASKHAHYKNQDIYICMILPGLFLRNKTIMCDYK